MSTIPDNPFDATKPETAPAIPTTADQRLQHANGNAAFAAAKTDVEALESGKEDAGVAAGLVTAHDGDNAAHGGVETAFAAHDGAGGTAHADATGATSGFMSGADKTKLDALDLASTGTVREIQQDGTQVTDGDKVLDFRATGDASVDVSSQAGGVTRIVIDATAGSGGGGISKSTSRYVAGEIAEAESSAGDGTLATVAGLTGAGISGHIADASLHFTEGSITHNNVGGRTTADAHPTAAITGLDTALAAKLENVIDDTSPQLGGELQTKGQLIAVTTSGDGYQAILGDLQSSAGAFFAYSPDGTSFDPADGGFTVEPGVSRAYGVSIVESLKHSVEGGRQVYVSEAGVIYGVDPPEPGWSDSATDTAFYARSGIGLNVWQQISGLTTTVAQAVTAPERLDVSAAVHTNNTTSNRTGVVELGFGINGAQPTTPAQSYLIVESFTGYLNFSFAETTATLAQNDTIDVWVRVTSESNSQFSTGLQFDGGGGTPHDAYIGVPGSGGGGGSGDVIQGPGGGMDGDLAVWDDYTGKLISGAFPASNVAQLDALNTFFEPQIIDTTASGNTAGLYLIDGATALEQYRTTLAASGIRGIERRFSNGVMAWYSLDDAWARIDPARADLAVEHSGGTNGGGVIVGTPTGGPNGLGTINAENVYRNNEPAIVTRDDEPATIGTAVNRVIAMTQAQYDGITPDANTLYHIIP